jgi:hypothetical protein
MNTYLVFKTEEVIRVTKVQAESKASAVSLSENITADNWIYEYGYIKNLEAEEVI